ncbi:hypothetical protein KY284_001989 [Solanum tuberosum]|nr:hypothetical protein KY284_001989 [Solanum tuberosum]
MAKFKALLMIMALSYFTAIANSQVKNIFLLAGQSNMSGLGGVVKNIWDGIVPPECSPNPAILKLDANLQWVEATEPLHADIDVNVTCGIGPGMPFANSLLNKTSCLGIVGLVPCAMAGNKISEWQKGTFLYNQLVMRAKASIVQEYGVIRAMLWYQGESDTMSQSDANSYKGKMQQFFSDLRNDVGIPELLIIQVALASGGKHYTETVREAQLNPDLANVVTVDAKGLQLQKDNLHLTASSQVLLGHMMLCKVPKNMKGYSVNGSSKNKSCDIKETSRALAWLSLPGLPISLFTRKSLLSIALAAGRPIAIDKATQVRSRPSTARVKVELDLLDKHPKRIKLQYLDEESSKILEHFQEIVYDNLPLYRTNCKHQGHAEINCRLILKKNLVHDQEVGVREEEIVHDIQKYKGDARRILNEKRGLEEVIQRDDDKNPSTCTKNNVLVKTESYKSDDAMHNNSSPILVQKNPQAQADLNYDSLAEKISDNDAQDNVPTSIATVQFDPNVKEKSSVAIGIEHESDKALEGVSKNRGMPQLWKLLRHHNRLENTNSRVVVGASLVDSQQQLGDVNAHESDENHRQHLVVGQGKHAIGTEHEAITQRVEKSSGEVSAQYGSKGWNVVASKKATTTSTNSLMTSSGQKCVTNESRCANMVEEEEEHVTPHSKLSPGAPAFVPKGSSVAYISSPLHWERQLILAGSNVQKNSVSDKELIDALGSFDDESLLTYKMRKVIKRIGWITALGMQLGMHIFS